MDSYSVGYHGYIKKLIVAFVGKWEKHAGPLQNRGHIKLWLKRKLILLLKEQEFSVQYLTISFGKLKMTTKNIYHEF